MPCGEPLGFEVCFFAVLCLLFCPRGLCEHLHAVKSLLILVYAFFAFWPKPQPRVPARSLERAQVAVQLQAQGHEHGQVGMIARVRLFYVQVLWVLNEGHINVQNRDVLLRTAESVG